MLIWVWFGIFVAIGWIFAYRTWHEKWGDNDQLISHAAMTMAGVVSWDGIGAKMLETISLLVPESGSELHALTIGVSMVFIGLVWVSHPVLMGFLFMNQRGEVAWQNFGGIWRESK